MKFTVYSRPDGAYVLVPDCMLASQEAHSIHGPLTFCDSLDSEAYPMPAIWETVMSEVDQRSFAVLHPLIGQQLLGLDCEQLRATS